MPNYTIGLDFGTTNTKACISISHDDPNNLVHQFMRWKNEDEPYLFPSRVFLMDDDTLHYGKPAGKFKKEYGLFKMAVAEDQEFRTTTNLGQNRLYDIEQYDSFTPELLSIFFLTNALLEVKEKFKPEPQQISFVGRLGKLLGRTPTPAKESIVTYAVNLGIPTELSNSGIPANVERRRKFETILAFAHELTIEYPTQSDFSTANHKDLVKRVQKIQERYNNQLIVDKLKECQIKVIPESFAGLYSLIQAGQLGEGGCYATVDVGGGSSDVSFFHYDPGNALNPFNYYAAQSFMAGTSLFYTLLGKKNKIEFGSVKDSERLVRVGNEVGFTINCQNYIDSFRAFFDITAPDAPNYALKVNLRDRIKDLFDEKVTTHPTFQPPSLRATHEQRFGGGVCIKFGGGSFLPWPKDLEKITINLGRLLFV